MTKQHLPVTDSAAVLHDLVGDDATAAFESDPKFEDSNPTADASSENLQRGKDRGDIENLPDMQARRRSTGDNVDEDKDDEEYEDVDDDDEDDDEEDDLDDEDDEDVDDEDLDDEDEDDDDDYEDDDDDDDDDFEDDDDEDEDEE